MARIDGNDSMKNVYFGRNTLNVEKTDKTGKTEQTARAAETTQAEFNFGIGSKQQSDQIRGMEVEGVTKLPQEDMQELNSLAQIAGLKNISVTQPVYNRISESVSQVGAVMEEIETENNAQQLFASQEFAVLNALFGIV